MRSQHSLPLLLGALALLLTVTILSQSASARVTSPGLSSQQVYEHTTAQSFTLDARVPLTTPTPILTFTPTPGGITPTPTYSGPPDLVGQLNWIGACPNPVLRISTRNLYPSSPTTITSTTVLTNSIGDRIDITVPPFSIGEYAVYKDVGSCQSCIPFEWLCHLPFTEIVDYNNDIAEADETNNVASIGVLPPACDPCGPIPTATPTFVPTSTPPPVVTPSATTTVTPPTAVTPSATPTIDPNSPDLTANLYWSAVCPAPVMKLFTILSGPPSSYAPTSTMRLTNNINESLDFPVPALNGPSASYSYDCTVGPCMPSSWVSRFPFTLTVDYTNVVVESNESNNTAIQPYPPPVPTPCGITPTYTPTNTPTGTIPTATPSTTPTVCNVTFVDVPPGSTFYPYIHCLACMGIVNGYPDGTYRPNNNVTRGQLSKIVVLATGWTGTYSIEPFADVPQGSTFYLYIMRLYDLGYISGYPCGGPGEPCDSQQRPYFRPGASATRGQISKIVAQAAGITDPVPSGDQAFEDVPPSSTFWLWIERLTLHSRGSIISGYPCGSPGEPCVPPENRPYFRPNRSTTRGQMAKITSASFFPNCASR